MEEESKNRRSAGTSAAAVCSASRLATYTSKSSKQSYPGGKVERELEEIDETVDEFLVLALQSSASSNNLKK